MIKVSLSGLTAKYVGCPAALLLDGQATSLRKNPSQTRQILRLSYLMELDFTFSNQKKIKYLTDFARKKPDLVSILDVLRLDYCHFVYPSTDYIMANKKNEGSI